MKEGLSVGVTYYMHVSAVETDPEKSREYERMALVMSKKLEKVELL